MKFYTIKSKNSLYWAGCEWHKEVDSLCLFETLESAKEVRKSLEEIGRRNGLVVEEYELNYLGNVL